MGHSISVARQYADDVNELICLDMPCGHMMVNRIRRAWDEGDAVFPLDQRAPQILKEKLVAAVRPTRIASVDGERAWDGDGVEPGDAAIIATSGTTGEPKFAVHTLNALASSAQATHSFLAVTSEDKWLCCLPPSHVGGFGVIARSLLTNTALVAVDGFTVESFNHASQNGATLVSLVATALQRVDAALYRKILIGGSSAPSNLPANCVTTYGMTETGGGVVYNGQALHGVEIEIRDKMIYLKAPMLLRSYRDGTSPLSSDGWLKTGDLGSMNADGTLRVDGRQGDLIITGGENVWPEQVEKVISEHRDVEQCCVAGVPDPEWGHTVVAWLVLRPGSDFTLRELRDHVKEVLPAYCAPRMAFITDEIPRTSLGKPQRSVLAERRHQMTQLT